MIRIIRKEEYIFPFWKCGSVITKLEIGSLVSGGYLGFCFFDIRMRINGSGFLGVDWALRDELCYSLMLDYDWDPRKRYICTRHHTQSIIKDQKYESQVFRTARLDLNTECS